MPTPLECIQIKGRKGIVNQKLVDELMELADEARAAGATANSVAEADRLIRQLERRLKTRQVQTSLQFQAYHRITQYQERMYRSRRALLSRREVGGQELFRSLLTRDPRMEFVADIPNVETLRNTIRADAHALWAGGLENLRTKMLGLKQEKALSQDVLRALYDPQDPRISQVARDIAEEWKRVDQYLVRRAKAAGFDLVERRDWRMPQSHDTIAVRQAAGKGVDVNDVAAHRQAWKDYISPRLDRNAIISRATGEPVTDAELDTLLDDIFENIRTNGLNKLGDIRQGSGKRRPGRLADRHMEERVLVFKDADSQIEYERRFGNGDDYFSTMVGHVDKRATEVAMVEVLGPNPDETMDLMYQRARALDDGRDPLGLQNDYEEITGRQESPHNDTLAQSSRGLRNVLVSAQLGGAFLSALSDVSFGAITAVFNGMSPTRVLGKSLYRFAFGQHSAEERAFAVRMGLVAEEASGSALAAGRLVGEMIGPQSTRTLANVIMRGSLLSSWTQAGRHAFGLEMFAFLADNAGKTWDQLPANLRRSMGLRGIGEADWNVARSAAFTERRGTNFMDVRNIAKVDADVASKIHALVLEEMEFAVPSSTVRARAALKGGAGGRLQQAGTIGGELWRNIGMYKNFPVTLMYTHLARVGFTPDMSNMDRIGYLASTVGLTTLLGAMALNSKNIAAGKEPVDPFEAPAEDQIKFWTAAMLQGGGLGLFGDFLFADHSRFGKTFSQSLAGPAFGFADDVVKLGQNAVGELGGIAGVPGAGEANFGREVARFVSNYTPGSNLWYARLAMEREVFDRLQRMLDPEANESFRQKANRAQRDFGTPYFWAPGETISDRLEVQR